MVLEFLEPAFMQRALLAALVVGLCAPLVGIFLVQRRLSLMGDGLGHIALTGVALGFLLQTNPVATAVIVASIGAIVVELIRAYGKTSGDVALAVLFYGGIAGGVLLIGLSSKRSNVNLLSYLFGSLTTVSKFDIALIVSLALVIFLVTLLLKKSLFALCHDSEFAQVSGIPVKLLSMVLAVMTAVTVTIAMRVVGLLLVSALMIIPVATAQQLSKSFTGTRIMASVIGGIAAVSGVITSFYLDLAPGALIVVLVIFLFIFSIGFASFSRRRSLRRQVR
ncbi:MAG: metal ABC transporter permease [Actinobacteria bacterium]|nr:metal ABC transporter permease [Actinomycetota bacterium]MDA2981607.1 metal ABC transporter permease [Actinomycetota bacterium]MDA2996527.1 metal ABC transporter permease [Actinomycetota bacterium]